jgi:pimeloyl-ACP methyl ester carboxylesterase
MLYETRRQILEGGFPAWIEANGRPFVNPDTPPAMIAWVRNMMLSCSMKAAIDCNRAMIEADFRAELKKTHIPTLIIHGDRDASMPLELTSRRIVPLMPDVQLTVYENAPHGLPITHAARLNRDLETFLRSPPLSLPVAARRSA